MRLFAVIHFETCKICRELKKTEITYILSEVFDLLQEIKKDFSDNVTSVKIQHLNFDDKSYDSVGESCYNSCETRERDDTYAETRDTPYGVKKIKLERFIYYSNICVKVLHTRQDIFKNETQSVIQQNKNAFGNFDCLYSEYGNIMSNSGDENRISLIRASTTTKDVMKLVEFSMNLNSISKMYLYMMVASCKLSHPVFVDNCYVEMVLRTDKKWRFQNVYKIEDSKHSRSFKLSNFEESWLRQMQAEDVKSILIVMTSRGSVNMFLSLAKGTIFFVGIEDKFRKFHTFFFDLLNKYS